MKILIVNSDSNEVENISRIFRQRRPGWQFTSCGSGAQCLNMINNDTKPDLIILGTELVDMAGLNLIELVRADSDIPVIFISRKKDMNELVKAFDSGANDYIVTPFSEVVFIARSEALIRRRDWDTQARADKLKNGTKQHNNPSNIAASLITSRI
jgi:two-component system KDP operon response regulator KdpE